MRDGGRLVSSASAAGERSERVAGTGKPAGSLEAYRDLGDWLQVADGFGEIRRIAGGSPRLQMGRMPGVLAGMAKGAKPEQFYDNSLLKELEDSGFIKEAYAGVK